MSATVMDRIVMPAKAGIQSKWRAFASHGVPAKAGIQFFLNLWTALRRLSGDDAYERYLAHCRERHPGQAPMGRGEFFKAEQDRRWDGVRRCC